MLCKKNHRTPVRTPVFSLDGSKRFSCSFFLKLEKMPLLTNFLSQVFEAVIGLFFPKICSGCGENAVSRRGVFCFQCSVRAQLTNHLGSPSDNEFIVRVTSLAPLIGAAAMYYFRKSSPVRQLIHSLKYRRQPEIGRELGRVFGRQMLKSEAFRTAEVVVAVPLHPKKERLRGYNQSGEFAQGLSEVLEIPFATEALGRVIHSASQTTRGRSERLEAVQKHWVVRQPELLRGKSVLLVDDVLTTGSTLDACGQEILALGGGTRLLLATLAIAMLD